MPDAAIDVTIADHGVAQILLVRPELFNRFDPQTHGEIVAALTDLAANPEVRAIVLGSTGKAFSAGGDFELMQTAHDDAFARRKIIDDGRHLVRAFLETPQPIVVAVQGAAIGLGATVAFLCDVVVAARTASFADTHVQIGLTAGDGGCLVWPQSAGMLRARRYLLTGDTLPAETAYQFGMVTDLVEEADEVLPAAHEIASRIARNAPYAVQSTKKALNAVTAARAAEVVDLAFAYEDQTLAGDDVLEGIAAFRERRSPNFTGR